MAYLPTVTARLAFSLGDMPEQIDRAKAKLDELKKTIHDTVKVDTSDLDRASSQLAGIHRNATVRVNLDDADAKIRLAALTRDRSETIHVRVDSSQLGMLERIGGAIPGSAGPVPLVALPAIAGGLAALLPELAGIVSGLAAAGAGAGAFAALALPAFRSVSGALSQIKQDQEAYNRATTDKGRADALKHLADDWKGLDGPQKAAVKGIQQFTQEYHSLSKSFEGQSFDVFTKGLKVASDLLPKAVPFAQTFARSFSGLLTQLDKGVNSQGFAKFLSQLRQIEGPATTAIGQGIGKVAAAFGRLITVMSGKDVAHTLNIAFGAISGTLDRLTYGIRNIMNMWDALSSGAAKASHAVSGAAKDIASGFMSLMHWNANTFSGLWEGAKSAASKTVSFFAGLPGQIKAAFSGTVSLLAPAGSAIMSGLVNGAKSGWSAVNGFFGGIPGKIVSKFANAASILIGVGENIVQGLISGMESKLGALSGVVSRIAGIVKSVAGVLGIRSPSTVMYGYGVNAAEGLALGMMAGAGQVGHAASTLAGMVSGPAAAAAGHGLAGAGGGEIHIHNTITLDGKVLHSEMSKHAVQAQRRTGSNQYTKRTR